MFIIKVASKVDDEFDMELETKERIQARYAKMLLESNGYACEVFEEREPRPVKFKGI